MADKVATDFLSKVKAKGKQAMSWFRDIVKKTRAAAFPASTGRAELMDDRNTGVTGRPSIGRMYLFQYDAKYKNILPYWDRFPLVFPFDVFSDGFYGINIHYLNVESRIKLMTALMEAHGISGELNDKYFMKLSYSVIKDFKPAKECIKRYINKAAHRKSPFYGIAGNDWSYAAALPLQKFVGPQPW